MNIFTWVESKIPHFRWYDISLIKLSTAAFILMVAKLWPPFIKPRHTMVRINRHRSSHPPNSKNVCQTNDVKHMSGTMRTIDTNTLKTWLDNGEAHTHRRP